MDAASPSARNDFQADLCSVFEVAGQARVAKTNNARHNTFGRWTAFCHELGHDPTLSTIPCRETKLCYMLVFAHRYRTNNLVRADAVDAALLAVGKGIAHVAGEDPRKPSQGSILNDPLLQDYLKALRKQDDPAKRVYPANLTILRALRDALDTDHRQHGPLNAHTIDLCIVGFFWLLRPGEYVDTGNEDSQCSPFLLREINLTINHRIYADVTTLTLNDEQVQACNAGTLYFSDQKNGVRGETISHCANTDPFYCPAKALARIVQRLRKHNAPPDTPIYRFWNPHKRGWDHIKSRNITYALRWAAQSVEDRTGVPFSLLSCRSLRPGGATALLVAGVDVDAIQLLGRWLSDTVLRYLRVQAATRNLSQQMLQAGDYTFAPGALPRTEAEQATMTTICLPEQTPTTILKAMETMAMDD